MFSFFFLRVTYSNIICVIFSGRICHTNMELSIVRGTIYENGCVKIVGRNDYSYKGEPIICVYLKNRHHHSYVVMKGKYDGKIIKNSVPPEEYHFILSIRDGVSTTFNIDKLSLVEYLITDGETSK